MKTNVCAASTQIPSFTISERICFQVCLVALAFFVIPSSPVLAHKKTEALFDLSSSSGSPFPSDLFTVEDATQNTGRRINLPFPDCLQRPSDCADLEVINTLDGFNLQSRLAIPFSGSIDLSSVADRSIFLVNLGNMRPGTSEYGKIVALNQIVWEPTTNTLYAESDELLDQHTRYGLLVTRAVRDRFAKEVKPSKEFKHLLSKSRAILKENPALADYRNQILEAISTARFRPRDIVAASVFTTQSATADLEKIQEQIRTAAPTPADFLLGPNGVRTVFPVSTVTGITFKRQVSTAPTFDTPHVFLETLQLVPGAVGTIAFGKYRSPNYETEERIIPPVGTLTDAPPVQTQEDLYFNLFIPAGLKPPNGWPVAIFGHGFSDDKNFGSFLSAAVMAANGIAQITINVVGHGGGPLGTLEVDQFINGAVTFPAGGRGIDQNGDGVIDSGEGVSAAPTKGIISSRDGLRQTTIDLMQLVREIQVDMDVDGDGRPDLDPSRIYFFGQSFGGIYGTTFLGVEPDVRVGVLNVAGGSVIEAIRLGTFRPLLGLALKFRVPSLTNVGGASDVEFNENMPLRNQAPLVNTVAGAIDIQQVLENTEWVSQSSNPVAYAPHLRQDPLLDMPVKTIIYRFAPGAETVPNPKTTSNLPAIRLSDPARQNSQVGPSRQGGRLVRGRPGTGQKGPEPILRQGQWVVGWDALQQLDRQQRLPQRFADHAEQHLIR